jgi:protein-S-isoprenylcysteine O-methyltransferase Ste14
MSQITAWTLLIISLILIYQGIRHLRTKGRINRERDDPSLTDIEKTTELVTSGLYGYIRHPFYCSLLCLAWGIFFKHITWLSIILVVAATFFLVLTAKKEEQENIAYFGDAYIAYMQITKMFIPYIF